jgi:tRNA-Thr(GGU) m(6)t(6)A37 methyltransferase TsaA
MADAVLPTCDAGAPELYQQINRPHPDITYSRLLDGMIAFRDEYKGKLWVEVMLVQGLNDTEDALHDIAQALQQIAPDEVHINLPTRPPAETWVKPPDHAGLRRATTILGDIAYVVSPTTRGHFDLSGEHDVVEAIQAIIARHPIEERELEATLARWSPDQVADVLSHLRSSGRAQSVIRSGVRFWTAATAHFPEDVQSRRTNPLERHRNTTPDIKFQPIGYVRNAFDTPVRSSQIRAAESEIILLPELVPGLDGLKAGQHILIVFHFHLNEAYELHQHPRGDTSRQKRGVFALRSPYRPNPIGVTEVVLREVKGNVLRVRRLDALNNTPVLDIKPV